MSEKNKKKSIAMGCATVLVGLLLVIAVLASIRVVRTKLFISEDHRFSVEYPRKWEVHSNPQPRTVVVFVSPRRNSLDMFKENVSITYTPIPNVAMDFDKFTRLTINQLKGVFEQHVKVDEASPTKWAGLDAYKFVYEGQSNEPGDPLKFMHIWAMKGRTVYMLTFVARKSQYKSYLSYAKKIINSFEFF